MSLKTGNRFEIPAETARVAKAAFPKSTVVMRIRDTLGVVYTPEQFTDLFPLEGQPAEAPTILAWVVVLQFMENLTDRQAAEAVRSRIDWKYALGLELTDPGFDFSVLGEFRTRLIAGQAEMRLLDQVLELFKSRGVLKARGRQRTDSTHVLAAVRDLNRLERVGETLRAALNDLATVDPSWTQAVTPPTWYVRYGRRFDQLHLPISLAAREQLGKQIGRDGFDLLKYLAAPGTPESLKRLESVAILRTVWAQQYRVRRKRGPMSVEWSKGTEVPAAQQIESPYDPEAHYCTHNHLTWTGYKVHFTETCDPAAELNVITHVATTPATHQDVSAPEPIHQALASKALLPREHLMDKRFAVHLVDAGYVDADLLVESKDQYGIEIIGPFTKNSTWQARENTGFDLSYFQIDWPVRRATCPQGHQSIRWQTTKDRNQSEANQIHFAKATCQRCPARSKCTRAATSGRILQLRSRAHHEAVQRQRLLQTTQAFLHRYRKRLGIEGTISQAVRVHGLRRTR